MSRVYAYKYPGSEVFFCRRADPATSSRDAPRVLADAVERLGRIAAPLALEVKVAAYPDTFPLEEDALVPEQALTQWAISPWPEHVAAPAPVRQDLAGVVGVTGNALPPMPLILSLTLGRTAPEGFTMTVQSASCERSRVRIDPRPALPKDFAVEVHGRSVQLPVERRGNELWVAGPARDVDMSAPVGFSFANLGTDFRFTVSLGWSLCKPGSVFQEAFLGVVSELLACGWQIEGAHGIEGLPAVEAL